MNPVVRQNQLKAAYGQGSGVKPELGVEERTELALKFLPIVRSEVARFKSRVPRHVDAEELHGVAVAGLMRAIDRGTGVEEEQFGAYVRQRIRGAILDELRRLDVFTRTVRKKARLYDEALHRVEQREGRIAKEDEIRMELGLSRNDFNILLEELRPISFLSIEKAPSTNGQERSMEDRLEDLNAETIPSKLEGKEIVTLLKDRLSELPANQQKVLHMYYFKDYCLAEIAEVFDLSESRICQIHTHAIRGLRTYLNRIMDS